MYTSLSHHEQSILHRRNSAPVYHDARLGATREIVGGQRRWLCTCTPGTHINTVPLITSVSLACQADDETTRGIWFHPASMIEINLCTNTRAASRSIWIGMSGSMWIYNTLFRVGVPDERKLLFLFYFHHRKWIYEMV